MKKVLFLVVFLIACSCSKEKEECIDLDRMAFSEETPSEQESIAEESKISPQEMIIREPLLQDFEHQR